MLNILQERLRGAEEHSSEEQGFRPDRNTVQQIQDSAENVLKCGKISTIALLISKRHLIRCGMKDCGPVWKH